MMIGGFGLNIIYLIDFKFPITYFDNFIDCSTFGAGFNGTETNCEIAHGLGIFLINSNYCFAILLQRIYIVHVC